MSNREVVLIAEIANSHQGSASRALETAIKFYNSGADIVKFQVYTANDLVSLNHKRWLHFDKQSFTKIEWNSIFNELERIGIPYAVDVFGLESLRIVQGFKPKFIKVHLSDIDNIPLHREIALCGFPVALGAGGAGIADLYLAIESLQKLGVSQIILFHGFQAYPTLPQETNLERMRLFKEIFKNRVLLGISDHIEGDDELSVIAPMIALGYGVRFIEKHVTLKREEKGVDYYSSMNISTFRNFALQLNRAKELIGKPHAYSKNEINYYGSVKKVWIAKKEIKKGEIIREQDIINVRINESPRNYSKFNDIIGKRATCDIQIGSPIEFLGDS